MSDQLSAKDWLDQGLKALAANGVTALKAEPLAKAMGVSRGSFYWHFDDIGAFRTAILAYWPLQRFCLLSGGLLPCPHASPHACS
jgi:AcrR family transcriptional regulator